jgi:UDP-N-acetylglucosamine:LPS N-acetylglucosamine transferase
MTREEETLTKMREELRRAQEELAELEIIKAAAKAFGKNHAADHFKDSGTQLEMAYLMSAAFGAGALWQRARK